MGKKVIKILEGLLLEVVSLKFSSVQNSHKITNIK